MNVAEILKKKNYGIPLWYSPYGKSYLVSVRNPDNYIIVSRPDGIRDTLLPTGRIDSNGDVLIFPSKDMRDWSKFTWKMGNVLINKDGLRVFFEKWTNSSYTKFYGKSEDNSYSVYDTNLFTLASDKDTKETIEKIELANGGVLNLNTLKFEKYPQFKPGDVVVVKDNNLNEVMIIKKCYLGHINYYASVGVNDGVLVYANVGYDCDLRNRTIRLATEDEKTRLFKALAEEGKSWNAIDKVIVDLSKKPTFKTFDKVLVKDRCEKWGPAIYISACTDDKNDYPHCVLELDTIKREWKQFCIPFEGNEELMYTTKEP